MNSKVYRWCGVPQCENTTIKTPNKLFVFVPQNKTIRNKWLKLARRDSKGILPSTHLYFCEDHFDLPNDMDNYMEYYLMGSVSQIRMKLGCMPTKFQCQPDRRKRTSDATKRPYILKKQRKTLIEECQKDLEERTTKQVELEEMPCGSSGLGRVQTARPTSSTQSTSEMSTQEPLLKKVPDSSPAPSLRNQESEADLVTKCWSMKLQRLAPDQRIFAEKIINDTLFEAAMGTLTRHGVNFITEPSFVVCSNEESESLQYKASPVSE